MNGTSQMLLLGIGTAGCSMARGVSSAFGPGLRYALADTDATTGTAGGPFTLLGGDRLSGRGAGGDVVSARLAAEDSVQVLDEHLEGVRLAVVVTALGGGTGGGATLETLKHLSARGIVSIVFATTPFAFEGEDRQRNSRGIMSLIEEAANATFFLPLDKLAGGEDSMNEAMTRAVNTVASGVTLFWRLVEKPGYIRLDAERLRHLVIGAGRGRFATATAHGPDRAEEVLDSLIRSELLATASSPVRAILCGVLAGDDLRLSEIGRIADGLRGAFGNNLTFQLATVNDDETFAGRLSAVAMLFESDPRRADGLPSDVAGAHKGRGEKANPLKVGPSFERGRFKNAEATVWHGEDLDIPTFVRLGINLEF